MNIKLLTRSIRNGFEDVTTKTQRLKTMASKKITPQDMKSGKIYRCYNCEIKCDDKYAICKNSFKCGQVQEKSIHYGCSLECAEYIQREEVKMDYIRRTEFNSKRIEEYTKLMSATIGKIHLFGLFDCIKMYKAENKALKLLLSREGTSAEIIVAFNTFRDCSLALSEILQDDKITKATGIQRDIYESAYPDYLRMCEMMRFATEMMDYKNHDIWCVD